MVEAKDDGLFIPGASGHAKVIIDMVRKAGQYRIIGLFDDNEERRGTFFQGIEILGKLDLLDTMEPKRALIAIGSNDARLRIANHLSSVGYSFPVCLHPSAVIGEDVIIGEGTVVMANAVINPGSRIGKHCIINTAATVDHDNTIEDFVHLSPGCHLAGNVTVCLGAHCGTGVSAIPGTRIGRQTIVGAGAVVVNDIPDGCTAVGVPAKVIKKNC